MEQDRDRRKSMALILGPMLATFAIQRTVLHHSSPDTHVYIAGYVVHHLFWGLLLLLPTAMLLGLGIGTPWRRNLALGVLGFSGAMVLDEVVYLIFTDASGVAYRGSVSLVGALFLMGLASLFLGAAGLGVGTRGRRTLDLSSLPPGEAPERN